MLLRRRQHAALPGARRAASSCRTSRPSLDRRRPAPSRARRRAPGHADRLRRRLRQLRQGLVRRRGHRRRPRRSTTSTEPAYKDLLVVENPATSSPGLAFLLATVAAYGDGRLAGLLGGAPGQRREGRRRLGARRTTASSPARRARATGRSSSRTRPARRPRSCSRDPQPTEAPTGVADRHLLPPDRVRRRARGRRARGRGPASSSTSCSASTFQADIPLNMFVFPVREGAPLPEVFTKYAAVPDDPLHTAARRDRRQPGRVDRGVDRTSSCGDGRAAMRPTRTLADAAARCGADRRARSAFLAVFFVWPVVTIVGAGARRRAARSRRRAQRPRPAAGGVVHALAGGRRRRC